MRLLQLTAGTGSFFCGTCLRDASLVEELRRLGHDALLAPLYLPLVLEEGLDAQPVRMGGLNVWLAQAAGLRLPRLLQENELRRMGSDLARGLAERSVVRLLRDVLVAPGIAAGRA